MPDHRGVNMPIRNGFDWFLEHQRESGSAEEVLRNSEAMYRGLVEQIPAAVYIAHPDFEALACYVSPHVEAMTGYHPDEWCVIPSLWRRLLHPEDREMVLDALTTSIEKNDPFVTEYRLYKKNGDMIWIQDRGMGVRDDSGRLLFFQGVMVDITAQKEREHENLLEGQKLESLGVLAGGIAHDFNNLLTSILGFSSLALTVSPEGPAREMVEQIEKAAQQGADLTRQLLAYAGKGRFVLKPIDLNELIEEMSHLLRMAVSGSVTLEQSLTPDLPAIEADVTQIRQLVMNLITNASDALGNKAGKISLRTGTVEIHEQGLNVFFEVSDTGIGMDEATRSRMFDPFFTTKPTGRGLGLAAAMGIIRGHGGGIDVRSVSGAGSTIRVYIPASGRPARELNSSSPESGTWKGSGTVLIVDDEESVRDVAGPILEHSGFMTLTASGGSESIEIFKTHGEDIVAVLLDMKMPGLDGLATGRVLKQMKPEVPVILMSGYQDQEFTDQFADIGLSGFIRKPFKAQELSAKLQEVLTTRS